MRNHIKCIYIKVDTNTMSGVLRRGSLSFDLDTRSNRGSVDSNLYGGYRDGKVPRTPEISVISLDFRRQSDDLKKDFLRINVVQQQYNHETDTTCRSKDIDSDIISNYIGHYGKWNFIWTFILSLFQITPTFQMFSFVFQVSYDNK